MKTIEKKSCFYCLISQLKRLQDFQLPADVPVTNKSEDQQTQMAEENVHLPLSGERRLINLQMKFIKRQYSALMFCFNYDREAQHTRKENRHKLQVIKKKQVDPQHLYTSRYSSALCWNDLCSTLLFVLLSCPEALMIIVTTFASVT